jgi:hypothetical protein
MFAWPGLLYERFYEHDLNSGSKYSNLSGGCMMQELEHKFYSKKKPES